MEDSTPEGADAEDLAQSPIDCTKANLERFELSYCQRVNAAKTQSIDRKPYDVPDSCLPDGCTPDEKDFPRYAASFHKLLKHNNNTGLLTTSGSSSGIANYRQLLKGLKINNPSSDFDDAALNSLQLQNRNPSGNSKPRFLINPRSSKSLNVKGPDIAALDVAKIIDETSSSRQIGDLLKEISLGSAQSAAEMTEAYGMAILRDLVFESYTKPMVPYINDVSLVIDALNAFGSNFVWGYRYDQGTNNISRFTAADEQVTRENLFRGPTEGDRLGDYLSVFLTFNRLPLFAAGCAPSVADLIGAGKFANVLGQPLRVPQGRSSDFEITFNDYVDIQNAKIPQKYPAGHFFGLGPLLTGRNLGEYTHTDNVYEHYIRAADVLTANIYPRSEHSPYSGDPKPYKNEADGPTLGPSDAYGLIGGVRIVAERAAFTQKYLVARRARPEVMGALIHLVKTGKADLDLKKAMNEGSLLFTNDKVTQLLERVREWNGSNNPGSKDHQTYLLSQMYPEGSPAHPAWPSGHATVAGACITVLKAIFQDTQPIIDPDSAPPGSGAAKKYRASNGDTLTVGRELDKLASNIALGRNFGGVHYRSDGEHGILLGEEVAIRYLQDHLREYRESFKHPNEPHFEFTKRNGMRIRVTTAKDVVPV